MLSERALSSTTAVLDNISASAPRVFHRRLLQGPRHVHLWPIYFYLTRLSHFTSGGNSARRRAFSSANFAEEI